VALASPPADVSDGALIRWGFEILNTRFEGIDPTGRAVAIDGMDHLVVRDGTIVSNFIVSDQMQFARQIGMLPPDGSAGDRATKAAFNARARLRGRRRR
jgi:hypothetical protein